jgi:MscS family membrane protein
MTTLTRNACALVTLLLQLSAPLAFAQEEPTLKDMLGVDQTEEAVETSDAEVTPAPVASAGPVDDYDRGVPRTSVEGFRDAAEKGDWKRAAEYLDLRKLPGDMDASQGPELARDLTIVLDRALWIDLATLSSNPKGHPDDGLPAYRDRAGVIETPEGKIEVLLQRVPRGDGVLIWKFSNRTVGQIPTLYQHHGYGPLTERLLGVLPEFRLLGFESWQWVTLICLGVGSYLLAWLVTAIGGRLIRGRGALVSERIARLVTGPIRLLLLLILMRSGVDLLAPSLGFRAVLRAQTLLILVSVWVVIRGSDLLFDHLSRRMERREHGSSVFVRPLRTATRIVVVLTAVVVWLDNVGFSVTTLLAGLGIGGLAIALAAQKSLEDLFAAITLYSGRVVRVGDFCRFGDTLGTVEEIGLRWTRVRKLDHTLLSLPNSEFARQPLENFAMREKIWFHPRLQLRYETTPEQLRYILVEVRRLFYAHPKVLADPARIRFVGFGDYSLDLDVFAYVDSRDYGEYLEIAEDLNLQIMDIVARAGSAIAVPSQTAYLESGSGLDAERARAAEARVGEWREKRELYLPRFPEREIAQLQHSLPYPPEGSPEATRPA